MLIGADLFAEIHDGHGPVNISQEVETSSLYVAIIEPLLEDLLKRFWEVEEIPKIIPKYSEDDLCEKIFLYKIIIDKVMEDILLPYYLGPIFSLGRDIRVLGNIEHSSTSFAVSGKKGQLTSIVEQA